ncbi:MAG: FapA family protein [bacterium]|jgi:hypothetical protein
MKIELITDDIRPAGHTVEYDGNVEIVGTVKSGARLEVNGDIGIFGNVEDADIVAAGNVMIDGGFLGTGGGRIACHGGFKARFVQGQRIEAGGDVKVAKGLISSTVYASGRVLVGKSGGIVGGETHAYRGVEAGSLGSPRPVTTVIKVGIDPAVSMRIEELEQEAMSLAAKRIRYIKDLSFVGSQEGAGSEEAMRDLTAASSAVQAELVSLGEEIMKLRMASELAKDATIAAREQTHPPLDVAICFSKIINESRTGPVVFRLLDDRIVLDTWNLGW